MFDIYELYGSRVADLRDVRSLLSHALGVVFEFTKAIIWVNISLLAGHRARSSLLSQTS